ncbi:hypothetical protein KFK09_029056 [Dendrobium nobile]|uniref:HTH myb-type domain-containing protein n=1 Tax=Dendrobium nobile TaxID=94219 RepID=A0A8T3A3M2_DENNO|nr:hypothetical protein KFK09_029056 [Dendrobium nobile]
MPLASQRKLRFAPSSYLDLRSDPFTTLLTLSIPPSTPFQFLRRVVFHKIDPCKRDFVWANSTSFGRVVVLLSMGAPKQKWTADEESALKAGVVKHGAGKWRTILKDPEFFF